MPKTVSVLLRSAPLGTHRTGEGLRMAVGQTLADHRVHVILSGPAVYILIEETRPEVVSGVPIRQSLETLAMLGHSIIAEEESLQERSLSPEAIPQPVSVWSRAEIAAFLAESDVVLVW